MRNKFLCFQCHTDDGKGAGPPLINVADAYLARYKSDAVVRRELTRRLRKPSKKDALLGGTWPTDMPPIMGEGAATDAEVDAVVTFLMSCSGDRPVSDLR